MNLKWSIQYVLSVSHIKVSFGNWLPFSTKLFDVLVFKLVLVSLFRMLAAVSVLQGTVSRLLKYYKLCNLFETDYRYFVYPIVWSIINSEMHLNNLRSRLP
jgi:hypothetical protein